MLRRLTLALAWGLAVGAALVTGLRWVDLALAPLVVVQSVSWWAGSAALVGLLCGVAARATRTSLGSLAAVCALVLAVHTLIWTPWLVGAPPGPGKPITVLTVNLYRGQADAAAVGRAVRDHDVDVLVLAEITPGAKADLRRAGVERLLPYAVGATGGASGGTVLRSRLPLTAAEGTDTLVRVKGPVRNPPAQLHLGRQRVAVRAVHLSPPTPDSVRRWRTGLRELTAWAHAESGRLIVLGDFNASIDHPGMRQLLGTGLRDAHEVAGAGRPPTWPRGKVLPAFVHIDHVLVRGVGVASAREVAVPGSDHYAVLSELVVPRTTPSR